MVDFSKHLKNRKPSVVKHVWKPEPETREAEVARLIRVYGLSRAGHSLFSPSGSAGWLNCAGYLLANAVKDDMAGEDAAYGTVAHGVAAVWLTAIRDEGKKRAEHMPKRFLDHHTVENGYKIVVDANMLHHIRRYIDWCEEVEILGDVFIEQHIEYSEYMPIPNQGGTADHFVCVSPRFDESVRAFVEDGYLIITDLKMGIGVRVFVEYNSQAMLYALGVYLEWNWLYSFKRVKIRICQPRLDYFGEWECSIEDLLIFAEEARVAADKAWRENAPRSPSPKACQWCNDKTCVARSALLEDLADDCFDEGYQYQTDIIDGKITKEYTTEELENHALQPLFGDKPKTPPKLDTIARMTTPLLAWRYRHRSMYDKFFREIGVVLLERGQTGEFLPGLKIKNGRRSFSWSDPDHAAQELSVAGVSEDKIFISSLVSVSKAKEALRAIGLAYKEIEALFYNVPDDDPDGVPLVFASSGKPTLTIDKDEAVDIADDADDGLVDDDEL